MSQTKNYLDVVRTVPETDETDWGAAVTAQLCDLLDGADSLVVRDGSLNFLFRLIATSSSLAASATLTPETPLHLVQGASAAVTLDTTTAIDDGYETGQILVLVGAHATNTVTIEHDSNVQLNGDIVLGQYDVLALVWNSTASTWIEIFRNS